MYASMMVFHEVRLRLLDAEGSLGEVEFTQ